MNTSTRYSHEAPAELPLSSRVFTSALSDLYHGTCRGQLSESLTEERVRQVAAWAQLWGLGPVLGPS